MRHRFQERVHGAGVCKLGMHTHINACAHMRVYLCARARACVCSCLCACVRARGQDMQSHSLFNIECLPVHQPLKPAHTLCLKTGLPGEASSDRQADAIPRGFAGV